MQLTVIFFINFKNIFIIYTSCFLPQEEKHRRPTEFKNTCPNELCTSTAILSLDLYCKFFVLNLLHVNKGNAIKHILYFSFFSDNSNG